MGRKGHEIIGEMFETDEGQRELEKQFSKPAGYLASKEHQSSFAGGGVAYFPAQSNDLTCNYHACNIGKICEIMTDEGLGDELARLVALVSGAGDNGDDDDDDDDDDKNGLPSFWGYQTCT